MAEARDWPHSSLRTHLAGRDDGLVTVRRVLDLVANFADLLATDVEDAAFAPLRRSELIGRPLGSPSFVAAVGARLGRRLAPGERGRKPSDREKVLG